MKSRTTEPKHWPLIEGGKLYLPTASVVEVLYGAADQDGYNAESVCDYQRQKVVIKTNSLQELTQNIP